jgi:hypothetical protein
MILLNAAGSGRKPLPAGNGASSRMLAFRDDVIQMVRIMARKAAASKRRAGPARKSSIRRRKPGLSRRTATASRRRWSQDVTEHSDALTLEGGVFTSKDPRRIAASLKRSAERSNRRKSDPFRSALSMLTFYINRAGKNLPSARKKILMQAKEELRKQFGKD